MAKHGQWTKKSVFGVSNQVSKGAKIRNRCNQVPHLTQDTSGKVLNLQLDTTNESQEVSPFPAGDHKAHINRRTLRHSKHKTEQKHKRSTKEVPPWNGQSNILLEGLTQFHCANLTLNSDVDQNTFGKVIQHKKTQHMAAKRSALSQQVTTDFKKQTRHQNTLTWSITNKRSTKEAPSWNGQWNI